MGLQLSTRGRYGVRALTRLVKNYGGQPLSIQVLSEEEIIPLRYLEQIMGRLRRDGIVESIRGPKGGYWLEQAPDQISLGHVLEVLEGSISLVWCVDETENCPHEKDCPTALFWSTVNAGIRHFLDKTTLAQLNNEDWGNTELAFKLEKK